MDFPPPGLHGSSKGRELSTKLPESRPLSANVSNDVTVVSGLKKDKVKVPNKGEGEGEDGVIEAKV